MAKHGKMKLVEDLLYGFEVCELGSYYMYSYARKS